VGPQNSIFVGLGHMPDIVSKRRAIELFAVIMKLPGLDKISFFKGYFDCRQVTVYFIIYLGGMQIDES
jgi:hypothetical protein